MKKRVIMGKGEVEEESEREGMDEEEERTWKKESSMVESGKLRLRSDGYGRAREKDNGGKPKGVSLEAQKQRERRRGGSRAAVEYRQKTLKRRHLRGDLWGLPTDFSNEISFSFTFPKFSFLVKMLSL